jgi:NitT/TauT family transport system substrate-binding protein
MENGKVDAAVMMDPAFSFLQKRVGADEVRVLSDARTVRGRGAGVRRVRLPRRRLLLDIGVGREAQGDGRQARAGDQAHTGVGSAAFAAGDRREDARGSAAGDAEIYVQAIERAKVAFSPDGIIHMDGAEAVYGMLKQFSPDVAGAKIDLSKTFTNEFLGAK